MKTDQNYLNQEKDKANEFLISKNIRPIGYIRFANTSTPYINVDGRYRVKSVCKTPYMLEYFLAYYEYVPYHPNDPIEICQIYEEPFNKYFSNFLVRVQLEFIFKEWIDYHQNSLSITE